MNATLAANCVFFAACPRGVSELLATELRELGIQVDREHPAGVSFSGPLRSAYLACLQSRTASRVLLTLADIPAADPEAMYRALRELPWEEHVGPEGTFAIDIVGESPRVVAQHAICGRQGQGRHRRSHA